MARTKRDRALTVLAVLFAILALSDFLKPLQLGGDRTGFVFFGKRLSGTPNTIAGPLFGLYLLLYATGIWGMRRWALWMGWLYLVYVAVNLSLFTVRTPHPSGPGYLAFSAVYAVVALGVAGWTVYLLGQRRDALT